MDRQEVFDKVARHLLMQGKKSVEGLSCLYRSADGSKCAVGCLIPDEAYDPKYEGKGLERLMNVYPKLRDTLELSPFPKKRGTEMAFLTDLQILHDDVDPNSWLPALGALACRYKLDTKVLDTFRGDNHEE